MSSFSDLAYLKSLDQGNHECEVFPEGAEADNKKWQECVKYPGHAKFIPVNEFSLSHLPEEFQIKALFEFITNLAALTVRVWVKDASSYRPKGYPFSKTSNSETAHTGSGYICYSDVRRSDPCPCPVCKKSATPKTVWWELRVVTARHVVYNTEEAKNTTIDVFYDDKRLSTGNRLYGLSRADAPDHGDSSVVYCVTHDSELANKVNEMIRKWTASMMFRFDRDNDIPSKRSEVCVVVSHPHGNSKHITIGRVIGPRSRVQKSFIRQFDKDFVAFEYTTPTCPGSSGAPVFVLNLWARDKSLDHNHHWNIHSEGKHMKNGEHINWSCYTKVKA